MLPLDVADAARRRHAAHTVEDQLGEIDMWVNNAMVSVFSPIKESPPDEFRRVTLSDLSGRRYGNDGRAATDVCRGIAAPFPGRIGARLSWHSAPGGVLRGEARDHGLLRLLVLRTLTRRKRRSHDDGPDAGDEHAAIRLGEEPMPEKTASPADFPAGGRRRRGAPRRADDADAS